MLLVIQVGCAQTAALGAVVHSAGEQAVLVPVPPVPFPMHASVLIPVPASALARVPCHFFYKTFGFGPRGVPQKRQNPDLGALWDPLLPQGCQKGPPKKSFRPFWDSFGTPLGTRWSRISGIRCPGSPPGDDFQRFFV